MACSSGTAETLGHCPEALLLADLAADSALVFDLPLPKDLSLFIVTQTTALYRELLEGAQAGRYTGALAVGLRYQA